VKTQDATIKTKHKEFQTLQIEKGISCDCLSLTIEQLDGDITSAQEQLEEATTAVESILREVESLEKDHANQKVAKSRKCI